MPVGFGRVQMRKPLDRAVCETTNEGRSVDRYLNDEHMRKRVDLCCFACVLIDVADARQSVLPRNVHRTRSTNTFNNDTNCLKYYDARLQNKSSELASIISKKRSTRNFQCHFFPVHRK